MNTPITSRLEQEHFTPATREAIHTAQREAVRMNAVEVMPEHLFLGVLAQDGDEVAEIFRTLRLNQEVLRTQLATLFPPHNNEGQGDARSVPLSREAHACIEWAISFATHLHVSSVQLEHVLLGCMRHQRLQPLLALFLVNAGRILPFSVTERSGPAYTATIDQLITSRIRRRSIVPFNQGVSSRILSSFERPVLTFVDIVGFEGVKRELREVIDFLRNPQRVRQDVRSYLYGLLLVGPTGTSRTLIGQAIAGEAVVPLLSLSIPVLLKMVRSGNGNHMGIFGDACLPSEASQAERETAVEVGRRLIHDLFEQGKKASPCVICIGELDTLAQPEIREVCEPWQSQLRSEIHGLNGRLLSLDAYDTHPAMVVMATINRREQIDQLPLLAGCFDHAATLNTQPSETGLSRCPVCHQEVPAHWKYCGFCGGAFTSVRGGAEGKEVCFCPECGSHLQARAAEPQ